KAAVTSGVAGSGRRTTRDLDCHGPAAQLSGSIASPAQGAARQVFDVFWIRRHMDEELAIRHVCDGEVAASVRRGLRKRGASQSDRILEGFVVDFRRKRRSI